MSEDGAGAVIAVRHGETAWSATGKHTGRSDIPLDDAGRAQAMRVAPRLAASSFAAVLSSPLSRALETCRLAGLGSRPEIDPDLIEWDYGAYEGLTTEEIRLERPGWWMWTDGYPGGESTDDVVARADRVITRCRAVGGDIAVFSHGHFLRVLGARWIGLSGVVGGSLALSTAAVCELGWERDVPAVTTWNDVSHLRP